MIAPALIPTGTPITVPIANKATPTVATVLQELPVAKETIQQIIQEAKRK